MDNYREVELLAQKSIDDSGTLTVDINVDEPITELSVRFYVKNGTNPADELPPESVVSKIEIVDGGQVYASVNGREATAMAWYDKLRWPAHWYSAQANEGSRVEWPFQFGRYLGDPQYAFSPSRLLNPQLKVTWSKDDLHLTGSLKLDVNAKLMQGVTPPAQALLTKVIRSWTTLASGIVEVDLPTDRPYRRIYFGAFLAETTFANVLTHARFECGVGKLIVFDMTDEELMNLMERTWGLAEYTDLACITSPESYMSHLGFPRSCHCQNFSTVGIMHCPASNIPYINVIAHDNAGANLTNQKVGLTLSGLCPELTYCYPFGLPNDPATWFDAPKYNSIKLKITEGGAGAAASVFIQQPVSLP